RVPIFFSEYILAHYGTGAVMGVPAHDQRDFEFAQQLSVPVKVVVVPDWLAHSTQADLRKIVVNVFGRDNVYSVILLEREDQSLTREEIKRAVINARYQLRTIRIRTLRPGRFAVIANHEFGRE